MRKRPSRRTTTDNKGVTEDEISTKEGSNVKVINSNTRLYDIHLKGLHGAVNVGIRIKAWGGRRETRINDGSKCLDQGDNQDEGRTCTRHEGLCSGQPIMAMQRVNEEYGG